MRVKKYTPDRLSLLMINLDKVKSNKLATDEDIGVAASLIQWHLKKQFLTEKQMSYGEILVNRLNGRSKRVTKRKELKYWLYAMKTSEAVKLGLSSNPNNRKKTLQTSNKDALVICWRYYVGKDRKSALKLEKKLHRFCDKYHERGEWFDLKAINILSDFHP